MFCSPTLSYLCHKKSGDKMYSKMGTLFRTPPKITMRCVCYHYETRTVTDRDANGNVTTRTVTERVITYSESEDINYYSTRDVSGLFKLDIERGLLEKKNYIKLKLKKCIDFADAISYSDYMTQKTNFWQRNRYRDIYMDFTESRDIPGFNKYELVLIKENEPCFIGSFYYVIFTLLTFGQFYKMYVNSFCINQNYKIRKLISTRYNLLEPQFEQKYQIMTPAINLIDQNYSYQTQEIGCEFESVSVNLPTEEELNKAQAYESYVPNYQVVNVDSELNSGIVQDLPSFESVNYNAPPPGFENSSDKYEIPQNMNKLENNQYPNYQPPNYNNLQTHGDSSDKELLNTEQFQKPSQ